MAAPNIIAATSAYLRESKGAVTTSFATAVNNAAASGLAIKIVSLYVSNVDGSVAASISIDVFDQDDVGGTGTSLVSTMPIPANETANIIEETGPIHLAEDMSLGVLASAASDLEYVCAYIEYSE